MKRVLCAAVLGAVALVSTPAGAVEEIGVRPVVRNDEHAVGVGFEYNTQGGENSWEPGAGVVVYRSGRVCAGFSYQIPVCTEPIEMD